jgi:hypothetical protein
MIHTELELAATTFDFLVLSQLIKTAGSLLHNTPYSKMNKGLASLLIQ